MAILTSVPGLSVQIRVSEEIAVEYPDPDRDDAGEATSSVPTSHSYIESKDGSEYAIVATVDSQFAMPSGSDSVVVHVYLDGEWVAGIIRKLQSFRTAPEIIVCSEAWTTSNHSTLSMKRRFVFVPLSTNEDQESLSVADARKIKSCGSIKIIVFTARQSRTKAFQPINFDSRESISAPEKLLKGKDLSHGSSLTPGVLETNPRCYMSANKKEVGIFHFFYRSREALQRHMIIPRSPSPSSTLILGDELNNLSDSEICRLAKERLKDIKGNAEGQRAIKREAQSPPTRSQPWKMVKLDNGREAIDLSED